jgi:hypothetical protein
MLRERWIILPLALVLTFMVAPAVQAQKPRPGNKPPPPPPPVAGQPPRPANTQAQQQQAAKAAAANLKDQAITQLKETRALLALADRDYDGHRVKAVNEIAWAVHRLANLPGKPALGDVAKQPNGPEPQALSDAQLRQSILQLQQVGNAVNDGKHPRVVNHIKNAIKELEIALTIR